MKKNIALKIDFSKECQDRSIATIYPLDFSMLINDSSPISDKIRCLKYFYTSEKQDIIDALVAGAIKIKDAREKYNALILSVLSYLKSVMLPLDKDNKKGIFITLTGSVSKTLATLESDVDIDIFTKKEERKHAKRLFSDFTSAFKQVTGHKIEPFFRSVAGFDIFHLLYPNVHPSLWIKRLGFFGIKLTSIIKHFCDFLYKLIHSTPFKDTFFGRICSKCHDFIVNLFSTQDVEFYKEYFSFLIPFGFHPHRTTIAPNFFWGDQELFLSLFPKRHMISKDTSPNYKFALSRPIPPNLLDFYIQIILKQPFKSIFRLFPLIQLLGYLLNLKTVNYNELLYSVRNHPMVLKYLGTDFIDSIDFYDQFKFAVSIFRIIRKTHSNKESLRILANIMGFETIQQLTIAAKVHLVNYNVALKKLRANSYYFLNF